MTKPIHKFAATNRAKASFSLWDVGQPKVLLTLPLERIGSMLA